MKAYEKERIKDFRSKGMGYKAIASLMGLSRDSVRGFCRRNGLEGDSCVVALNMQEKIEKNEMCAYCKKVIKQRNQGRSKRFCCDRCRRKWWNENKDKGSKSEKALYKYTCLFCGNEFVAYGNKARKYCTHNCYIKHRFWRNEDGI